MTADRREYSRKPAFPDMSVPPPTSGIPPFDLPPPPHGVVPPTFPPHMDSYGSEFYASETDPYYHSYEPTQDSQWNDPVSTPQVLPIEIYVLNYCVKTSPPDLVLQIFSEPSDWAAA